jgi:nitrogen fixation protein FixH
MIRTFTGWHMATIMVGGFGLVVAVNFGMAFVAISTFGGVTVENSYVASQQFNDWLDDAASDRALGWSARLTRDEAGRVVATTREVPVGARVEAVARHPLGRLPDRTLTFLPQGGGVFTSPEALPATRWTVRLAIAADGKVWRSESDLR